MPRLRAFTRRAASVRLVSVAIFLTGVFAFEWARSSFRSVLLYSRRARFLGALTVFFTFLATARIPIVLESLTTHSLVCPARRHFRCGGIQRLGILSCEQEACSSNGF